MPELLLEIRCQEMSPAQVGRFIRRLGGRLFEELMSRGITLAEMSTGATPRRLALSIRGLPEHDIERESSHLGPPAGEAWDPEGRPTAALESFAAECGAAVEDIVRQPTESGERAAYIVVESGGSLSDLLRSLLARLLDEIADGGQPGLGAGGWARPVTGLLAMVDGQVLDLELDGQVAGRTTVGHPIQSPESFEAADWASYEQGLAERGIIVSLDQRRRLLTKAAEGRAAELAGAPVMPAGVARRWAAGCEIPGLIDGELDPGVLALPREVLITVLAERQDAVAIERNGDLLPYFLATMDRADDPDGFVRYGRQRAVAGDLLDALLTYERDRRLPLVQRVRRLEQLAFYDRLGTYAEKSQRLRELVELACAELGWHEAAEHALEAATLAKADLTTGTVETYPALHGILGGILAREEGYVEPVWQAIYDHAGPAGADAAMPRGEAGQVLAVVDRLGSLVGFFGLGENGPDDRRPAADPHRLRSLASELLRIVIDAGMELDLDLLAARAVLLYGDRLEVDAESILRRLQNFLDQRLDHLLGSRGFGADEIEAAKAVGTRDLPDLVARLQGLRQMRGDPGLHKLVAAARRMAKIVADAPESAVDPELLAGGAEADLQQRLEEVTDEVEEAAKDGTYLPVLKALVSLVPALERFFAEVLILDEDERLRGNRIALVQSCRRLCWRVARLGALDAVAAELDVEGAPWLASDCSTTN